MSRACNMNGGDEENISYIGGKVERNRPLGRQDVSGWTIIK
jgi:hypothetical protein